MDKNEVHNIDQETGKPTGEKAVFEFEDGQIDLHVEKREDVDHPLYQDVPNEYKMRKMRGNSDLETISFAINDPDFFCMLEGEAAVGKNMAIRVIADAANAPLIRVNFGMGTTYESLVGRYVPVDNEGSTEDSSVERAKAVQNTARRFFEQNENMSMEKAVELASFTLPSGSSFAWRDGLLTQAVKYGWWFDADEINSAEDEAIMPLNGLLEDRDSRYLTIEEKSEIVEPHPQFRFIATRNPIDYSGVAEMNDALESRGFVIRMNYHDKEAIKSIVKKRTDIVENASKNALDELVNLTQDIRNMEQSGGEIVTKISTRDLIKVGKFTKIKSIEDATKEVFLGIADPTDRDAIKDMIETQKGF